jgi:hypothetical protein
MPQRNNRGKLTYGNHALTVRMRPENIYCVTPSSRNVMVASLLRPPLPAGRCPAVTTLPTRFGRGKSELRESRVAGRQPTLGKPSPPFGRRKKIRPGFPGLMLHC